MRNAAPDGERGASALALEVPMLEKDSLGNEALVPIASVSRCLDAMIMEDLANAVIIEPRLAKLAIRDGEDINVLNVGVILL